MKRLLGRHRYKCEICWTVSRYGPVEGVYNNTNCFLHMKTGNFFFMGNTSDINSCKWKL